MYALTFHLFSNIQKFCLFACLLVFWCSQIYLSFPPWFELLCDLFKESFPSPSSWRNVGRHLNISVFLFTFNSLIYLEFVYLFFMLRGRDLSLWVVNQLFQVPSIEQSIFSRWSITSVLMYMHRPSLVLCLPILATPPHFLIITVL